MIFSGNKIKFKRGDDDALVVKRGDGLGFAEGDKVFFSVRANAKDQVDLFEIEADVFQDVDEVARAAAVITIPSAATIELECKTYYYDIFVQWADGTGTTLVGPFQFILNPGGRDLNE